MIHKNFFLECSPEVKDDEVQIVKDKPKKKRAKTEGSGDFLSLRTPCWTGRGIPLITAFQQKKESK